MSKIPVLKKTSLKTASIPADGEEPFHTRALNYNDGHWLLPVWHVWSHAGMQFSHGAVTGPGSVPSSRSSFSLQRTMLSNAWPCCQWCLECGSVMLPFWQDLSLYLCCIAGCRSWFLHTRNPPTQMAPGLLKTKHGLFIKTNVERWICERKSMQALSNHRTIEIF